MHESSIRKAISQAALIYGIVRPNVTKTGGLQSQGGKGAAIANLLQALGNAESGVLRFSRRE